MSALEALIQLVEDGKLDGISIDTKSPAKTDSLLLVFPGGVRLEVRAEYQYDEGGRSYLAINDESLPPGMELSIGTGV